MSARPTEIGEFRLIRPLGRGGMGEVYLAEDRSLDRKVAIKLIAGVHVNADARARFALEAKAVARLKHPNVVTVYRSGELDGHPYLVSEYVEGTSLDQLERPVPRGRALAIARGLARGLAAAHREDVLHRDVKPANAILGVDGVVKLLDFGLAKLGTSGAIEPAAPIAPARADTAPTDPTLPANGAAPPPRIDGSAITFAASPTPAPGAPIELTVAGTRMGTPRYMSPEAWHGGRLTAASDVYSLGIVLWELFAGRHPFEPTNTDTLSARVCGGDPPSITGVVADLPEALAAVIDRAVRCDPSARYADAGALLTDLELAAEPVAPAPRRARSGLVVGAAVVVVGGAIAVVAIARGSADEPRAAPAVTTPEAPAVDAGPMVLPTPVKITDTKGCAYYPSFLDGDTLSFDLTRGGAVDLYELDLGGEPVQRTSMAGWEWASSRDGDDGVLFQEVAPEGGTFASRIGLAGGPVTRLFSTSGMIARAGDDYFHAPSPHRAIRRHRDGSEETLVQLDPGMTADELVASPDERSLAFISIANNQRGRLCVTAIERPAVRCFDGLASLGRPAWSADGASIYFRYELGLGRVDVATGRAELLTADIWPIGGITVSPDGASLVYSDCGSVTQLVVVTGHGEPEPLLAERQTRDPASGPDGILVFIETKAGIQSVVTRDAAGTMREVVRHPDAMLSSPAFSADGELITYGVGHASGQGIYLVRAGGLTPPNRLTDGANDRDPFFLGGPDGDLVFTRDGDDGQPMLMRVSRDGARVERASNRPRLTRAVDHGRDRVLLSSPDRTYFYWWDPATAKESPGPKLPGVIGDVAISPDGRWLLLMRGEHVLRMRLDQRSKLDELHVNASVTIGEGTIDDDGRASIESSAWLGELWRIEAPAGTRW